MSHSSMTKNVINVFHQNIVFVILIIIVLMRSFYIYYQNGDSIFEKPKVAFEDSKVINIIRDSGIVNIRKTMQSPHSELMLGIILGVDNLSYVPRFKNAVRRTGTIHVIVVSGYNINFVYSLVLSKMGTFYSKKNILLASLVVLFYTILSGFGPPVVRAWIMGTIFIIAKLYGREVSNIKVLFISGLLLALVNPNYLFQLSFQLSFLASLSLFMFSPMLKFNFSGKNILVDTFFETLGAQILVTPYIAYIFGEMSIASLIVNSLVLWVIPICTSLGFVYLAISFINLHIAHIFSFVIYPFLDIFVRSTMFFGDLSSSMVNFKVSTNGLLGYYFLIILFYFWWSYRFDKKVIL